MTNTNASFHTTTATTPIIFTIVTAIIGIAIGLLIYTGAYKPLILPVMEYIFKARAHAEAAKLKAQGLKEGEDFVRGELKGSKQAAGAQDELKNMNIGGLGDGLKKGLGGVTGGGADAANGLGGELGKGLRGL